MKAKKICAALLAALLILVLSCAAASAAQDKTIVILYTNDVHCAVDGDIGYAGLSAYKKEAQKKYGEDCVALVDAGDAIQGAPLGSVSTGAYPVEIINRVGYDVFTPGNHEFDYGMDRFLDLMGRMQAAVVSCNFIDLKANQTVFAPYAALSLGGADIAFIGVTTPRTLTSSNPASFKDADGNYAYGFREDDTGDALYRAVQSAVDAARSEGAQYIVLLGHCGSEQDSGIWSSGNIIANVSGIDIFIDAHSHLSIEGEQVADKDGKPVLLTSSGSKMSSIGEIRISPDGGIASGLVAEYAQKDEDTGALVNSILAECDRALSQIVAHTAQDLTTRDIATGERAVRFAETNLGDLCADAYRIVLGADIGFVNGGGVRADIAAGQITLSDIISVHPFGNMACVIQAAGQEILDALEMGARLYPEENGGFLQVSGLKYQIDASIPSSVSVDDKGMFVSVDGAYRVKNVKVLDAGAGRYEKLDLDKTYTLAAHNFMLKSGGDGYSMFPDNPLIKDEVMLDSDLLAQYIVGTLGGQIGAEYQSPRGQGRIGPYEKETPACLSAAVLVFAAAVAALAVFVKRK